MDIWMSGADVMGFCIFCVQYDDSPLWFFLGDRNFYNMCGCPHMPTGSNTRPLLTVVSCKILQYALRLKLTHILCSDLAGRLLVGWAGCSCQVYN